MPQSTLLGYFTPIQPRPIDSSKLEQPEFQLRATLPVAFNTKNNTSSSIPDVANRPVNLPETLDIVRAVVDANIFTGSSLDFFVPVGQPQAAVVKVLASHTARLKSITRTLLPVRYPDKFFNECLDDEAVADVSRVVLWNSQPVGWIRCRLEDDEHGHKQIYVQAIGVLAPYRGCGLATSLLEQVIQPTIIQKYNITSIYCHVWELNHDAIKWYEKRDFRRVLLIDQYYRRLRPAGGWIMRKELT